MGTEAAPADLERSRKRDVTFSAISGLQSLTTGCPGIRTQDCYGEPGKDIEAVSQERKIAVGSDADILLADRAGFAPKMLLAGGCLLMWDGKPVR